MWRFVRAPQVTRLSKTVVKVPSFCFRKTAKPTVFSQRFQSKMEAESKQTNVSETKNTTITIDNEEYTVIKEGKASVLFKGTEVFYNPVQEVNRDLSILFIKLYIEQLEKEREEKSKARSAKKVEEESSTSNSVEEVRILEALSATGLRSIRYMKEIQGITSIVANDIDATAVEAIKRNIEFNNLSTSSVIPSHSDAISFMYANREPSKQYEIVDLDPYGGANIFLDGAVQSIKEGGLLCVTCTDMQVLCGGYPETCFVKYNSVPLHAKYCHEMALRILLASISNHASVYKKYIVPVVSLSIDFYIRVFVRVYSSASDVKHLFTKLGNIYQCVSCDTFHIVPLGKSTTTEKGGFKFTPGTLQLESSKCCNCGKTYKIGGPIWIDPIHDKTYVEKALKHLDSNSKLYNQSKKIYGLLSVANEELSTSPLYYTLSSLCNTLHCVQPPFKIIKSGLLNAGYKVSSTHACKDGIKTDAPSNVVWDVFRKWVSLNPVKNISENSPAHSILATPITTNVDLTVREDAITDKSIPRFLPNPRENWGPGSKAKKRSIEPEKAKNNQGKNKKKKDLKKIEEKKEDAMEIQKNN